jgi:hypothetical protein
MGLHPFCFCPNPPECVEGEFCEVELPIYGVLRSSLAANSTIAKLAATKASSTSGT